MKVDTTVDTSFLGELLAGSLIVRELQVTHEPRRSNNWQLGWKTKLDSVSVRHATLDEKKCKQTCIHR